MRCGKPVFHACRRVSAGIAEVVARTFPVRTKPINAGSGAGKGWPQPFIQLIDQVEGPVGHILQGKPGKLPARIAVRGLIGSVIVQHPEHSVLIYQIVAELNHRYN